MPLPVPFITQPLANLLITLDDIEDQEIRRRDARRQALAVCMMDDQNPDCISRAIALREIISKWNTLANVVAELKEAWMAKNGLPAHVALAHSFAACTTGQAKWRVEMADRVGKIVRDRIVAGRDTEGWQKAIDEEDKLTSQVERFDHLLFKIKGSLEMFGNFPSITTFNRALADVMDLGSSFPWLNR
jgi:hypothetical protein